MPGWHSTLQPEAINVPADVSLFIITMLQTLPGDVLAVVASMCGSLGQRAWLAQTCRWCTTVSRDHAAMWWHVDDEHSVCLSEAGARFAAAAAHSLTWCRVATYRNLRDIVTLRRLKHLCITAPDHTHGHYLAHAHGLRTFSATLVHAFTFFRFPASVRRVHVQYWSIYDGRLVIDASTWFSESAPHLTLLEVEGARVLDTPALRASLQPRVHLIIQFAR